MEFLKDCARRLDEGEAADTVLEALAARYTTPRSLNVKTCLVRKLCGPSDAYVAALEEACAAHPDAADALRRGEATDDATRALLAALPPRLPDNVRALRVARAQMLECKRLGVQSALRKNRRGVRVDGRALLAHARAVVARPKGASLPTLATALMLLTGRRTCEILNGHSTLTPDGDHFVWFRGQAKRRRGGGAPMRIPVLAGADVLVTALSALRDAQRGVQLTNEQTTRRYQSLLGRTLLADPIWQQCRRVHGLRAVYASMALRLFDWGTVDPPPSSSYVVMRILGHAGLNESLVYTTYHLAPSFDGEPRLGVGLLAEPPESAERPVDSGGSAECAEPLEPADGEAETF